MSNENRARVEAELGKIVGADVVAEHIKQGTEKLQDAYAKQTVSIIEPGFALHGYERIRCNVIASLNGLTTAQKLAVLTGAILDEKVLAKDDCVAVQVAKVAVETTLAEVWKKGVATTGGLTEISEFFQSSVEALAEDIGVGATVERV